MTWIELGSRQRRFGAMAGLALLFCCSGGPLLAQTPVAVDTLADGSMEFIYPEDRGGLTIEEKIERLNQSLTNNPTDAQGWNDLGVLYTQLNQFPLARDAFIKAVQVEPEEGDYHRNLGLVFSRLDMFDLAASEFDAYRRFDTMGGIDYWRLIGGALAQAGQVDRAREEYQAGITALESPLGPEGLRLILALNRLEADAGNEQAVRDLLQKHAHAAKVFLDRAEDEDQEGYAEAKNLVHNRVTQMVDDGKLLEESDLLAEAADLYGEAYELDPDRDDLLPRLVDVHITAGDPLQARVVARLARDDHPDKAGTWIATGRVYEQGNRLDEAVTAYQKAFELDSSIEDLRVAIGNLLLRLGRDREAREFLREGINSADTKPEVVYNYAISLMRDDKYHAAIASLRGVVHDRPEMFQAWSALAQCLRRTKQYSAAVEPYRRALELNPEPKLAYNLGICAQRSKRYQEAISGYEQALAMDAGFVEARYNLSLTLMNSGQYMEAVASFDELLEIEPDSYRAYYSRGLSNYYLGRYDEALDSYDLAMDQKETVNLLNNIGLVYDKLGNKKEAAAWYKAANKLKGGK